MRFALVVLALALSGCATKTAPPSLRDWSGKPGLVTLTNLHPGPEDDWISSANFQRKGLIPVCTPFTLVELRTRSQPIGGYQQTKPPRVRTRGVRLRDDASGRTYAYIHRRDTGEPVWDYLARYFGSECPPALESLSEIDRRGVTEGKALVGMSKQGVVFAMGYPPLKSTPSLEADRWIYWQSRFDRLAVEFDGTGHVKRVKD